VPVLGLSPSELADLLKVLREAGVTRFECADFSLVLGETPVASVPLTEFRTLGVSEHTPALEPRPEQPKPWHQRMWNRPPRFPERGTIPPEEPLPTND
jgi:hypothetical protein